MFEYRITPKAPLVFRDGKPFGTAENYADTLAFPLPSTIAGALRTAWVEGCTPPLDYTANTQKIVGKRVMGPLLLRTSVSTGHSEVLFPAPADSLCLNHIGGEKIVRLTPAEIADSTIEGTDLVDSLIPVFLDADSHEKPASNAPTFWSLDAIVDWLSTDKTRVVEATSVGERSLPVDVRTHVAIDSATQTHRDSHLFQTAGLDFSQQRALHVSKVQANNNDAPSAWTDSEFSLLSCFQEKIEQTCRTIGGESRLGYIQSCDKVWPDCPKVLCEALSRATSFRLVLATPAKFDNGYLPDWLGDDRIGTFRNLTVQLRAASVPRWQAGTSWDMASPKSQSGGGMRTAVRLTPAGSVYWFDILNGDTGAELCDTWLTSISEQPQQDGFGLVVPGIWSKDRKDKQ